MKKQSADLWEVEITHKKLDSLEIGGNLWILAETIPEASKKALTFCRNKFGPGASIKSIRSRGTIDVF